MLKTREAKLTDINARVARGKAKLRPEDWIDTHAIPLRYMSERAPSGRPVSFRQVLHIFSLNLTKLPGALCVRYHKQQLSFLQPFGLAGCAKELEVCTMKTERK